MKYQKIWSLLVKYRPKHSRVIVVYSDRLEESARRDDIRCWHPWWVDYKPTLNEQNKIRTHRNFSGFDRIDSIKICASCGLIVARNKKTE